MTLVERRSEDHVATVTLNRPEALNAISGEMADDLTSAFRAVGADPDVWVMILAAAGDKAFSVGADLKERNRLDDAGWLENRARMRGMFDSLRAVPQPSIAAVFGYALGGGFELALACDLIVASDESVMGLPEVRVGIVPGGGGTQLLSRRVGAGRAKDLILTGRRMHAEEALAAGLVARVVPRSGLAEAAASLAVEIRSASPVSVRQAKRAIDAAFDAPMDIGIEIEDQAWRQAVDSEDRREGIAAFNEKREPRWKGR
jgi:enoyl-CoA hydratase/carnithine racemase